MRYVVAIDVGIKNLGLCVFDFVTAKFVMWQSVSLVPQGRYVPANNVKYVTEFVKRFESFFSEAACVVIERQMRCNMRIIEAVLQTLFVDRCVVINARCVKAHYNLSMKNYRLNKEKAIEWAAWFVRANPGAFAAGVVGDFNERTKKKDDLADALLLTTYYLDTYSNQLSSTDVSFQSGPDVL